jgi:hypothetical protein
LARYRSPDLSTTASAARFSLGVIRWHNRVVGYAFILVTDRYPPFRLRP